MERGNSLKGAKGKFQVTENTRANTDILSGGGEPCISIESSVMELERRGFITWSKATSNFN